MDGGMKMKLAEALILRADHQKRLAQLKERLLRNARVQEGDSPAENPDELLEEIERVADQLTLLIEQINRTNLHTHMTDDKSLTEALAIRDVLRLKHTIYSEMGEAASIRQDRFSRSEVKFQSTVDAGEILQRADDLARQYRELDARIQETNWGAELME